MRIMRRVSEGGGAGRAYSQTISFDQFVIRLTCLGFDKFSHFKDCSRRFPVNSTQAKGLSGDEEDPLTSRNVSVSSQSPRALCPFHSQPIVSSTTRALRREIGLAVGWHLFS
jgi:hypothetical protein